MRMSPQPTRTRGTIRPRPVFFRPWVASASSSGRTCRETSLHQNPLPRCTSRMATNSVELTPAFTGPTRRISGSFSPATWHSSSTMARRCRCLPAMSSLRTELATVGAWLGTCRPPWLLSSSEPSAVRIGLHVRCGRTDTDMFNQESKGVTTMGRLADKNILITGGNSGIGLAAAQEFDREGARVAICGLNEGSLQVAKETLGAGSLAVRADVSNLTDLDTMFATIKREFGHLDGVFVNAGYSEFLLFEEVTEQSFDKVIAVNFKGAYFTIQKALPLLRQGSSVIINASVGARKGWPTTSTVSTSKAAVVHLARILSAELVDRGIRVNTLSPGPTDTAMFGRFPGVEQGEAVKGVLGTNNPSKRIADPLEIAKLAVYLASDDSAYVVGADFLIDGGVTAISAVGA